MQRANILLYTFFVDIREAFDLVIGDLTCSSKRESYDHQLEVATLIVAAEKTRYRLSLQVEKQPES